MWMCIVVFALTISFCQAQSPSTKTIEFNHFSTDHGLSQNAFTSILQDKKGYLWFGTYTGLIKYDGYSFTSFHPDPFNKNSIPDNEVHLLCEDAKENIWIVGAAGVSKYDIRSGNFIGYHHDDKNKFSLPSENVSCLTKDMEGKIWIGTDAGLCFYDDASDKFINLTEIISSDTLCSKNISCLMLDHNGLLWIGTNTGINIYDPIHKKLNLFNPLGKNYAASNKEVICMLEDHSGNIWISLWNSGICRYNPSTGVTEIYRHSDSDPNSLATDAVNKMVEDSHQNIWAGMYGGISIYQQQTNNFKNFHAAANDTHSLSTDQIINLFEDKSGVMWIGTSGGGLNNYYPSNNKFRVYQNYDKDFTSHFPLSLNKNHEGRIFMTTFGAGVQEFNPISGAFKSYKVVLPNNKITGTNFSYGTLEASDGNLWVVSFDEGLYKLDRKSGKYTTIHSTNNNKDTTFHNQSNCIAEDGNQRLWIGTNSGLKCYDLKTKTFSGFEKLYRDTNDLSKDIIVSLYCDRNEILWIGGSKGLILFNTKTGSIKILKHQETNVASISNNTINCFYDVENDSGKIWIGTNGGGLNEYDRNTEKFVSYTMKDGLPDNSVVGILPDDHGNLWLSTNSGICKFTVPSSENRKAIFRNYDMRDGLPGNEFYCNTFVKDNDGNLYFGSNAGLVVFKPNEFKDNLYVPPVVITDFSVFNKSVLPNDSTRVLNFPADETKEIKLSYEQNNFSFTFSALSYIHPEKNKYAYKLEGYDKDWIYTDANKRFANYTNINPAQYTFKVKASNNDGIWNEEGVSLKIIITPPYWQTWWFRLLIIIAIAAVAYGIYSYRLQEVIRLQNIRNKISGDLHDDIGSTLNSISVYSEVAKQDQSKHAHALEMIGEASRKIIDSMSDIVWTINPENDSFENIILRMRSLAFNLLRAKNIEFIFKADESLNNIKLSMENRRNLFLIFKEAINNLIKYADASKFSIQLLREGSLIKLTISDNGNGFDTKQESTGNGLNSMKRRAAEIKALLQIESVIKEGTRIELTLKS